MQNHLLLKKRFKKTECLVVNHAVYDREIKVAESVLKSKKHRLTNSANDE